MSRRTVDNRGFTLIEMIVVIGILGVASYWGITAFSSVTKAWGELQAETELEKQVDRAFELFQEDISDALSSTLSGESILGVRRDATSALFFDRVLADDIVVIPIQHSAAGVRMRTGSKVAWQVQRDNERMTLVRGGGDLGQPMPSGTPEPILANANIVRLSFEFQPRNQPGNWSREWSANEHPSAVKMNLVVADRENAFIQIGREAVFPVNVR